MTYGGLIGGVGNLTQAGTGVLTLTGSNLSSGQTPVSAGSLQLGVGGATGTITGSIYVGNGTFLLDRSGTMSNGLAGAGPLVKIGSDSVTLNGNLSGFAGPISVTQGQLVLASPASTSAPLTSVYTAGSGGTLQFFGEATTSGTANATVLSQSGGVVQFNGTTVNLDISQATITAQSGGLVQFNNTTVDGSDLADTYCQSGALVQYQNANIYGGVLFGGGTYQILSGSAASTFNSIVNYGTLQQNGSANFTNVTNNGLITGSGGLTLLGGLNATNGTLSLGGTNWMSQWGGNNGVMVLQSGCLLSNSAPT